MFKFEAGSPACPVACKYCFITEHDARRTRWNNKRLLGINKACTFLNVSPFIDDDDVEQAAIMNFDWSLFHGDYVGFTAISDPFWPKLDKWFWMWLENVSPLAKLATCVTKWPLSDRVLKRLASLPNFRLVVSITGAPTSIENVPVSKHLGTLERAKHFGVPTLPICHPYISGVSDLSFLTLVKKLGYEKISIKGLRYDPRMASFIPADVVDRHYAGNGHLEILPNDGWQKKVRDSGLVLESPRQWYARTAQKEPKQTIEEAERCVKKIFKLAQIVSSSKSQEVHNAAIRRRM